MKLIFKLVLIAGIATFSSCNDSVKQESKDNAKGMAGENTYDTARIMADTLTPQEVVQDTFPGEPEKKDTVK